MLATGAGEGAGLGTGLTAGLGVTTGLLIDLVTADDAKPSGRVTGGNDEALEITAMTRGAFLTGAATLTRDAARGATATAEVGGVITTGTRGVLGLVALGLFALGFATLGSLELGLLAPV